MVVEIAHPDALKCLFPSKVLSCSDHKMVLQYNFGPFSWFCGGKMTTWVVPWNQPATGRFPLLE